MMVEALKHWTADTLAKHHFIEFRNEGMFWYTWKASDMKGCKERLRVSIQLPMLEYVDEFNMEANITSFTKLLKLSMISKY